jgi:hypothetical protein
MSFLTFSNMISVLPALTLLLGILYSEELLVWIFQVGKTAEIVGVSSEDTLYILNDFHSIVAESHKTSAFLDREAKYTENEEDISISYPARYIFVLLVLFPDAQLCGSDIQKNIKRRFREKVSNNALYPLLHRMCKEQLIDNLSQEPRMHYYCITELGKKILRRFWQEFKLIEQSLFNIDKGDS